MKGMIDMGMTNKERYGGTIGMDSKETEDKKHYDSIEMHSDKMPEGMGEMHAGENYKICIEMLVKSVETTDDGKKKYKMEMRKMGKMPDTEEKISPYKKSEK